MKKVFYSLMAVMLAATAALNAQGQGQGMGDNEKLTAYKIAFFTQRLDLTPAEAEKFWPLYNDFSARRNKLLADRLSLMRYAAQNEANMSNDELSSTADRLAKSFSDEATMVVTFNTDLKKVLPPAKVIRLYQIENQYKQQLLRELNQRRQGQTQGTGFRGRTGQVQD
ncbi:MAG: hypothetical protein IH592_14525 [Bacteroidales bacterium]|nr:hypothetical protein [Bacteroidales bacterium]